MKEVLDDTLVMPVYARTDRSWDLNCLDNTLNFAAVQSHHFWGVVFLLFDNRLVHFEIHLIW